MMKNLYEVFEEFEKASKKQDKIAVLRNNSSYALKEVLRGTFDPNIQFTITSAPPYKASDAPIGLGYTSIHQELSRVYLFEKNNPKISGNLTDKRKEQLLIQILESLESREAEIYMNMILKKSSVKGLTSSIVMEAFPDLLPN